MYNELIKKMNIKKGENIFIASDILRIGLKDPVKKFL